MWLDTFSQAHPSLPLGHWRARLPELYACWDEARVLVYARGADSADGMIAVSRQGQLRCLFVARAIQGSGAGSALLHRVLEEYPGLAVRVLEENLVARYFFQRHGFREQQRSFCPVARQEQLLMERAGDAGVARRSA